MKRYNHSKFYIFFAIILFTLFTACSKDDNPINSSDDEGDHAEAVGLVISSSGQELARYEEGAVTGRITVTAGEMTPLLSLSFIAEDGDLFTPEGDAHSLDWEVGDTATADVVHHDDDGKWKLHIQGIAAGSTTLVIKILHHDHDDFVSAAIPVVVTE